MFAQSHRNSGGMGHLVSHKQQWLCGLPEYGLETNKDGDLPDILYMMELYCGVHLEVVGAVIEPACC